MHKKDYIVRQFEEFGKVLGVLLFLKREKDWEKFEKEIALAGMKFTNLELDYVEKIDLKKFEEEILTGESLSLEQKKILASILFETMEYYALNEDRDKQKNLSEKCYLLYSHIHNNQTQNEFNLEVHYRLEFLKKLAHSR